jgi:hypothetical protein
LQSFSEILTLAVADALDHGYDSAERVEYWVERLRVAALESMTPQRELERATREYLETVFRRQVDHLGILRYHPNVARFTLQRVRPELRAELDRRILASAALIKNNREQAVAETLQRFRGWMTSIPPGGTEAAKRVKVKADIRKSLPRLRFEERRVAIDQSHKLISAISEIVATGSGAIAGRWRSHWRQPGYRYRIDHKERDDKIYAVRDNWAIQKGLMKVGPAGYTDEITSPGFEVYCRCYYIWITVLTKLPDEMLTAKGKEAIRAALAA